MNGNEYPSGSFNTNGMKAGTFLQKNIIITIGGIPPLVHAAFLSLILIPPFLPPSVHHLVKSSPFLSLGSEARVLSLLFNTLAQADILFIP